MHSRLRPSKHNVSQIKFLTMEKKDEKAKTVAMPKMAEQKTETATQKADEPKRTEKAPSIAEILEAQLKAIQHKKKLADNREIFLIKKRNLQNYTKLLQQQAIENVFASDEFSLNFSSRENYRDKTDFSISNPEMLLKFLVFLDGEIDDAVAKIEKELLQDIA